MQCTNISFINALRMVLTYFPGYSVSEIHVGLFKAVQMAGLEPQLQLYCSNFAQIFMLNCEKFCPNIFSIQLSLSHLEEVAKFVADTKPLRRVS